MTASEYAKQTGWKSLTECAEFLKVGRANLATMWNINNIKCKALITGGWIVKSKEL